MPGTSYKGIDFPHLRIAAQEQLDDIILVTDQKMINEFSHKTRHQKAIERAKKLVQWNKTPYKNLGRSSQAALAVAKILARETENKDFLIIGYDSNNRYAT